MREQRFSSKSSEKRRIQNNGIKKPLVGNYSVDFRKWNDSSFKQRPGHIQSNRSSAAAAMIVGTSVEYDLPSHIMPTKGAGHLLKIDQTKLKNQTESSPSRVNVNNFNNNNTYEDFLDRSASSSRGINPRKTSYRSNKSIFKQQQKTPVCIDLSSPMLPDLQINKNYDTIHPNFDDNLPSSIRMMVAPSFKQTDNCLDEGLISQTNLLGLKYRDAVPSLPLEWQQQSSVDIRDQARRNDMYQRETGSKKAAEFSFIKQEPQARIQRQQDHVRFTVVQQQQKPQQPPPSYASTMAGQYMPFVTVTPVQTINNNLNRRNACEVPEAMTPAEPMFKYAYSNPVGSINRNTSSPMVRAQAMYSTALSSTNNAASTNVSEQERRRIHANTRGMRTQEATVDFSTPMVGAVPPEMVHPSSICTAHIIRSRGSPKVKCTKRHVAAANANNSSVHGVYHRQQRPRSNTIGHVGYGKTAPNVQNSSSNLLAMDLSSSSRSTNFEASNHVSHNFRLPPSPLMSVDEDCSSRSPTNSASLCDSASSGRRSSTSCFSAVDTLCSNPNSPDYLGGHNLKNYRNTTSTSVAIKKLFSEANSAGVRISPVTNHFAKKVAQNGSVVVKTPTKRFPVCTVGPKIETPSTFDAAKQTVSIRKVSSYKLGEPKGSHVTPCKMVQHMKIRMMGNLKNTGYHQTLDEQQSSNDALHQLIEDAMYFDTNSSVLHPRTTASHLSVASEGIPTPPPTNLGNSQPMFQYTPNSGIDNMIYGAPHYNMVC